MTDLTELVKLLTALVSLLTALEGFHFPWTRDRIRARYLLPGSDSNQ